MPTIGFAMQTKPKNPISCVCSIFRKENLKSLTPQHNNWNKGLQQNNESGVTGVRWNKEAQKWVAYIMRKHLGTFNSFEDAVKARKRAEQKYFGEFSGSWLNEESEE